MLSTGVEALDSRLGGIERRGHFVVLGPEGAGKSVLGLHFLIAGIEQQERCLLITGNGQRAVDARGLFLGFSPGAISSNPYLTVVNIHDAITEHGVAVQRNAPVEALKRVVQANEGADRIVIDDLREFVRGSSTPGAVVHGLAQYLAQTDTTTYILASDSLELGFDDEELAPLAAGASATIHLEQAGRGRRKFNFRDVRQKAFNPEPFLYTLRSGGGFSEDLPAYDREVEKSLRKRVVILDESGTLPSEVITALDGSFDVEVFTNLDRSLIELLEARYGVLVLAVDPYDPERAFNLTYTLRKSGNGAPILFISPSRGLRSMTRSRGLRIGGDDFLLSEFPPSEIVERIRITAHRGHHRRNGSVRADRQLQPTDDAGNLRPLDQAELRRALASLGEEAPSPFFALAVLHPSTDVAEGELWDAVRPQVRLRDGDLVAILPDRTVALVLAQVDVELARKVISRVRRSHPSLSDADAPVLLTNPLQSEEVRQWASRLREGEPHA